MPDSHHLPSRRCFGRMLAVAAAPALPPRSGALRSVAYNVLQCTGYPKGTRSPESMANAFARELSLYDPDLITFAESPPESLSRAIAGLLGMSCCYFPSGEDWPGTLITRLDVVSSENCPIPGGSRPRELFTRHWFTALLKQPGGALVRLHSLHLHPNNVAIREREITEVLRALAPDLSAGRSVLVQGDFNHAPDRPEYQRRVAAGLVDTLADAAGALRTFPSDKPVWRLDYILAAGPLARELRDGRRLDGGWFRFRSGEPYPFALSDHMPVFARFGQ